MLVCFAVILHIFHFWNFRWLTIPLADIFQASTNEKHKRQQQPTEKKERKTHNKKAAVPPQARIIYLQWAYNKCMWKDMKDTIKP